VAPHDAAYGATVRVDHRPGAPTAASLAGFTSPRAAACGVGQPYNVGARPPGGTGATSGPRGVCTQPLEGELGDFGLRPVRRADPHPVSRSQLPAHER